MKIGMCAILLLACSLVQALPSCAQQRQDVGVKLLIPSSARTVNYSSVLVVLNLDNQPNEVKITARRPDGSVIGIPLSVTIPAGRRFRSSDILGDVGAGIGEFGPITIESLAGRPLSAVSEVSSVEGASGFFPGINLSFAWREGFILEIVDTGDLGVERTYRTNIGINTVDAMPATVSVALHNDSGRQLGATTVVVPGNGLMQLNNVARTILNSSGVVTGQNGYLRVMSNQPIIAWASKIENRSNDPSFQLGVASLPQTSGPPGF